MHVGEKQGYLQMGKRGQVIEGAFGNAGDVVAMEGSEAEAQVKKLTPSNSSELSTLSWRPRLAQPCLWARRAPLPAAGGDVSFMSRALMFPCPDQQQGCWE